MSEAAEVTYLRLVDVPETVIRPPKKPRERDPVWDEMEILFGAVVSETNAHFKRNKAVRDLKRMNAQPSELQRAYSAFNASFPGATCTDVALATHFPMLRPPKIKPPCSHCGIGGGYHDVECPEVL